MGVASRTVPEQFPDVGDRVELAQGQILGVLDRLARLNALEASLTAFRLARRYLGGF